MANAPDPRAQTPVHPTLQKLVGERAGLADAFTLWGYIGPSEKADRITLFPNLDDLSESFELASSDVLTVEDAPEAQLPKGGKVLWVKGSAEITHRNTRTAKDHVELRRGRLRIQMRRRLPRVEEVCQTFNCQTCNSNCGINCQSQCAERRAFGRLRVRFR
jgi:hypothetical protein